MRILAVDTSSKSASAAVLDNGVLLCESTINTNLTHSQTIMPLISSMMKNAMLSLSIIDVFVIIYVTKYLKKGGFHEKEE